jgi:maltose alpha-D-glucosyltransferase/alpha-amylase
MKKKTALWAIACIIAAILIYFMISRQKSKLPPVDSEAAFTAAVKEERKKAGEDTTVQENNFWYKTCVIYALDIEVFKDSDGDGIGDIKGLIGRLDYIRQLGANTIWLAPFQPTPNQDDGYDITDFYGVDPRLGTMSDFSRLVEEARKKDMRIIMDLVVNHTSDQHPWFKQAHRPTDPYHSWYVWSIDKPDNMNKGMVFPGIQESIWTFDSQAGAYYYHRFYQFQPDLNMQNPAVLAEVQRIDSTWLANGVAGFRLDAVPFIIEIPQTKGEKWEHQFELLTQMRHRIQSMRQDAIILGEANVTPEETSDFFGKNGDGMHMMFNFFVNQYLFYALASGDIDKLTEALEKTKDIPRQAQWAQFLRNHDEIDLGRLSGKERDKVYKAFGPEKNMQLYDRGIRRRLAPMFNNDRRKLELAYSLLFSLPSTPVIRYGDEIGMGDNLALKERESVRTPMQWSDSAQSGFSTNAKTVRPLIDTGVYDYHTVNVRNQLKDSSSLLTWTARFIRLRQSLPAIGRGAWQVIPSGSSHVLILQYTWEGETVMTVHNFSAEAQEVKISPQKQARVLENLAGKEELYIKEKAQHVFSIGAYDYRWYRIKNL